MKNVYIATVAMMLAIIAAPAYATCGAAWCFTVNSSGGQQVHQGGAAEAHSYGSEQSDTMAGVGGSFNLNQVVKDPTAPESKFNLNGGFGAIGITKGTGTNASSGSGVVNANTDWSQWQQGSGSFSMPQW